MESSNIIKSNDHYHKAKADDLAVKSNYDIEQMSITDIQNLIKDFQVHQVELKMQNEELLRIQQELEESRNRYFDLYNFAPIGYLTVDTQGFIIDANLAVRKLLKTESLVGKAITSLIINEDLNTYHAHVQLLIKKKIIKKCVISMLIGDGTIIFSSLKSLLFKDSNGYENQFIVLSDVTESIHAEQNLQKTIQALTKANAELENYAYAASHDLREPLHNISSCTQLFSMKYGKMFDEEGTKLLNFTLNSVFHMNSLISDLLSYSRQGTNSKRFRKVDCNKVLESALENLNQIIVDTGAIVNYDALPQIVSDRTQVLQLFQNLISNSIKHHDKDNIQITVKAQLEGDSWLFSIKDNGPGIEEQYLDKIFQIFKRLNARSKYSGTGVGLAICKKVLENLGGQIWAESIVGQGSVFYFTLPVHS